MNASRLVAFSLFVSSVAVAQSPAIEAEALFRQGKQLEADGKIAEACAAFDSSQKLDPNVATMLNQAACREKNGQLATAWGEFVEAERQTRDATDAKKRSYNKVAKDHAAKLEGQLSKLAINVKEPAPGLTIKRNGVAVNAAVWNHLLPIDGGTYSIEASAPDRKPWSTTVTVANASDSKTVDVPALEPAPAAPVADKPVEAPAVAASPPEHVDVPPPVMRHRSKVVPIVIGAGAVALLGGGVALELSARSTYDGAKAEPDDDKQTSLWHSANNKRYAAEGLAVAGVAAAGVAVWLFVRHGKEEPMMVLAPVVDPDGGMLVLSGAIP